MIHIQKLHLQLQAQLPILLKFKSFSSILQESYGYITLCSNKATLDHTYPVHYGDVAHQAIQPDRNTAKEQTHMNNLISIIPLYLSLLKACYIILHHLSRLQSCELNLQPSLTHVLVLIRIDMVLDIFCC